MKRELKEKMSLGYKAKLLIFSFAVVSLLFFIVGCFQLGIPWSGYFFSETASVVGISASVPVNTDNLLAQQLKAKEQALTEKEKNILAKEAALNDALGSGYRENKFVLFGVVISSLLFALLGLNFYFDWKRKRA